MSKETKEVDYDQIFMEFVPLGIQEFVRLVDCLELYYAHAKVKGVMGACNYLEGAMEAMFEIATLIDQARSHEDLFDTLAMIENGMRSTIRWSSDTDGQDETYQLGLFDQYCVYIDACFGITNMMVLWNVMEALDGDVPSWGKADST